MGFADDIRPVLGILKKDLMGIRVPLTIVGYTYTYITQIYIYIYIHGYDDDWVISWEHTEI